MVLEESSINVMLARLKPSLGLLPGLPVVVLALLVLPRFDGLYGQDPYAYFDYAIGPLRHSLLELRWPPPFTWPPGYPLLVALTSLVVGMTPRAGQLVSLVAGALVPIFTALLAWEVWPVSHTTARTGSINRLAANAAGHGLSARKARLAVSVLSGLLAGLAGQLWQSSVVVMADTAGLAAATVGMWALVRYGRQEQVTTTAASVGWLMLAAAAMAFAVLTRWAYALVAMPCAAYALWLLRQRRRGVALLHGGVAALVALVVLLPLLLPMLRGVLSSADEPVPFAVDLQVYSWHPLNALRRQFVTADGLLSYRLPNGLWYALAPAHRFYFTPLLAPLLLPGMWAVFPAAGTVRRPVRAARMVVRQPTAQLLLLVGWAGVVYAFHAGAPWQNFRFNLAHLPALAILTAVGAHTVARWLAVRVRHPSWRRVALALLAAWLMAGLAWMAVGGWRLTRSFVQRKDADLAIVRQVEADLPPDATLITFGLTLTFQHYSRLSTLEIFYLDEAVLAQLVDSGRSLYLLLDLQTVTSQWQGYSPEINYRWLRENTTLVPLGRFPPYTLFQARSDLVCQGCGLPAST